MDKLQVTNIKIPAINVPCYEFNLDLSKRKRWKAIFNSFSQADIKELRCHGRKILSLLGSIVSVVGLGIKNYPRESIKYIEELEYIAKRCKMEFHEVVLLQMVYEAHSMCTSAIFEVDEKKYFFRTMDWDMLFLKKYTIRLNVTKDGKSVAEAIAWLGMVGFFTATSYPKHVNGISIKGETPYSVSINFRRTDEGSIAYNMSRLMTNCYPVAYLLRHIVNNPNTLQQAVEKMKRCELISPCYFIVCDWAGKEDCVITRDANTLVSIRKECLIQANCDVTVKNSSTSKAQMTGANILYSIERVMLFHNITKETKGELTDFLKFPILNHETIYAYYVCNGKTLKCVV